MVVLDHDSQRRRLELTEEKRKIAGRPVPTDAVGLGERLREQRANLVVTRLEDGRSSTLTKARVGVFMAWLQSTRPLRAWNQYNLWNGSILASGIGVAMFFSITGLLATGFSIAALVLQADPALLNAVLTTIAQGAPGLLQVDGHTGLVDPHRLLNPTRLGWTAAISALVSLVTSLGWISPLRKGLRAVMELPALAKNPVLLKVQDLATLLLLGVAVLITSSITVLFGTALPSITQVLGLSSVTANVIGYVIGFIVAALLNSIVSVILFRASRLSLHRKPLLQATILAGVATTILQVLSGFLLAKAGSNPLLASFAVVIGLLIWFNFVSQAYLLVGSWAAVAEADLND
jgi:membrane protein